MIILGIDPGYAILGYGIIKYTGNHFKTLGYGAITTDAKEIMPIRLKKIYHELQNIFDKYQPDVMAIEELFFNKNTKTALLVGQARGVTIVSAANYGINIYEYTPLQVKQGIVGYGRADKKQIQMMIKVLLNLKEIPKPDDVADALGIAICHAHSGMFKESFKLK